MVIILRGISGCGKSTLTKFMTCNEVGDVNLFKHGAASDFAWQMYDTSPGVRTVFSADNYFMLGGVYSFDPSKLPSAHSTCLRLYDDSVRQSSNRTLIVDNTNCSVAETAPYAALALAYDHRLQVVTLVGDPNRCWERNQHGVSFPAILRQDSNLRKSLNEWPSWYPQQVFPV